MPKPPHAARDDVQGAPPPRRPDLTLRYDSAAALRRDRLPREPMGIIVRSRVPVDPASRVDLRIEVELEGVDLHAVGSVLWVTPLGTGSLSGMAIEGATATDRDRLAQLMGTGRPAAGAEAAQATQGALAGPPVLSVAMLQPSSVLRQVISAALLRLGDRLGEGCTVRLDAGSDTQAFLALLANRRHQLAVVDTDALEGAEEALIDAIRSHEAYRRLPVVLLSGRRPARLEDPYAVTMSKPLAMSSFLRTTELLLRA